MSAGPHDRSACSSPPPPRFPPGAQTVTTISRLRPLDSLRGVAVILVVLAHCSENFPPLFALLRNVSSIIGPLGVQLFFIVSGYTMLLTFGDEPAREAIFRFYVRRIFRIGPLFWTATICYGLLYTFIVGPSYWAPKGITAADVVLTSTFLHWLTPSSFNAIVPGGWSIAIEVQFYLIFPLFAILFRNSRRAWAPYAIVAAIALLGDLLRHLVLEEYFQRTLGDHRRYLVDSYFYFWLPNQIRCFGFGMLLYHNIERSLSQWEWVIVITALCLPTGWGRSVIILYLLSHYVLTQKLSHRILDSVGQVSYSMYLLHIVIYGIVRELSRRFMDAQLPFECAVVIVLAISYIGAAFVTGPFIEEKSVAIGRKLSARLKPT